METYITKIFATIFYNMPFDGGVSSGDSDKSVFISKSLGWVKVNDKVAISYKNEMWDVWAQSYRVAMERRTIPRSSLPPTQKFFHKDRQKSTPHPPLSLDIPTQNDIREIVLPYFA